MEPQLKTMERTSIVPGTLDDVIEFHRNPKALLWLTPPPMLVQIVRDARRSLTEGEVEFNLWLGPVPIRWLARHEAGPTETSFADRMAKGPLAAWRHEHIFRPVANGVALTDRITFAHHPGWRGVPTRLLFDGLPLRFMLAYRHWRTRRALAPVAGPVRVSLKAGLLLAGAVAVAALGLRSRR